MTGIGELQSEVKCLDNYSGRGRIKTEIVHPEMKEDIHDILREHSQTDPTFRSTMSYSKMTATEVPELRILRKLNFRFSEMSP